MRERIRRRSAALFRNRLLIDFIVIFGAALLLRLATYHLDLFERFHAFSRSHESWELDEAAVTIAILGLAFIVFGIRRIHDQHREMKLRLAAEKQVTLLAQSDTLTGLPNRRRFREAVMSLAESDGAFHAILLIDLDGFTPVNDTLGQPAGDEALRTIARRLQQLGSDEMMCARVGGDEFAILAKDISAPAEAEQLAERVSAAVSAPIQMGGEEYRLKASIGLDVIDRHDRSPEAYLRHVNLALHAAKKQPNRSYVLYDAALDSVLEERIRVEMDLRGGLAAHQIAPFYQPVVDLKSGRILKFEALARWLHPTRGIVLPVDFIQIAEETGLIEELTDTMLRQACADALTWPQLVTLAVNLSPRLMTGAYALRLVSLLDKTGLPPQRLELEITEYALESDLEMVRPFAADLRALGVRTALDDFGTGYSGLARLKGLQFDELKIDSSFVQNMTRDNDARVIVHSIMELAHGLGMAVTAEGIETPEQHAALVALGCEHGQGYLFGRPMPADEAAEILRLQRPLPQTISGRRIRKAVA